MSHIREILTFSGKDSKSVISGECDEWFENNHGYSDGVTFSNKIFDDYTSAEQWLNENYEETYDSATAVRYKVYPELKSAKMTSLRKKFDDTNKKLNDLKYRVHYQGIASKSIKCKNCGAVLPIAYCGNTYKNNCPVCRHDLRPQKVLDTITKYQVSINELNEQIRAEEIVLQKKFEKKATLEWAVLCDVHC